MHKAVQRSTTTDQQNCSNIHSSMYNNIQKVKTCLQSPQVFGDFLCHILLIWVSCQCHLFCLGKPHTLDTFKGEGHPAMMLKRFLFSRLEGNTLRATISKFPNPNPSFVEPPTPLVKFMTYFVLLQGQNCQLLGGPAGVNDFRVQQQVQIL